jgi:PucR C-terminal helix-turn-helix domain
VDVLRPWHGLPPSAAGGLRAELPSVVDEIIAAVRDEVPAYAGALDGDFGGGLKKGVEVALDQFVDDIATGGRTPRKRVYLEVGRNEFHSGRSLEALLRAYRVGARVAWQRFSEAGVQAQLSPEQLYLLAGSIFVYIDELSALSAEGYAREQTAVVGEQRLRRQQLVLLLLREPAADALEVERAASLAEWGLPARLGVLAVPHPYEHVRTRLPPHTLAEAIGSVLCAIVPYPDDPARRDQLERAIRPHHAALGPAVPWREARFSLMRARAALELAADGGIPAGGLIDAREHAVALLLRSDRRLARELARERLAPLAELPKGVRRRLTETLAAWLGEQGRTKEVAARLHVHPQTVRYRVAQLRRLFGAALDEPERRFELELALRAERAVRPGARP